MTEDIDPYEVELEEDVPSTTVLLFALVLALPLYYAWRIFEKVFKE